MGIELVQEAILHQRDKIHKIYDFRKIEGVIIDIRKILQQLIRKIVIIVFPHQSIQIGQTYVFTIECSAVMQGSTNCLAHGNFPQMQINDT